MDFNEYDESERPTPDVASPQPQPDGSAYRGTGSICVTAARPTCIGKPDFDMIQLPGRTVGELFAAL